MSRIDKALQSFKSLPKNAQEKISGAVAKKLVGDYGINGETTQENLRRYSLLVLSMIEAAKLDPMGQALSKVRLNILQNLPRDIKDYLTGKQKLSSNEKATKEEIIAFYWGVPKFQEVFNKLDLTKDNLEAMIDTEIKELANRKCE